MCKPPSQAGRSSQDEPEHLALAVLLQAQGTAQEMGVVFLIFIFSMSPMQPIMSGLWACLEILERICIEGKTAQAER